MTNIRKTIFWVILFSIAMAFLETAVVVYLRKLYYPDGFAFPLRLIDIDIAVTEIFREIATLAMLLGIGIIAGRKNIERFAFFIFSFAIWDIFYYVFLKLLLGWPESLLTWDVLFLVPFTWVGPVLAPVLNSVMMIMLALVIIYFVQRKNRCSVRWPEWTLLIGGSVVVIAAYTEDYLVFMLQRFSLFEIMGVSSNDEVLAQACSFVPDHFKWWLFAIGAVMHLVAMIVLWHRNLRKQIVG